MSDNTVFDISITWCRSEPITIMVLTRTG